MKHRCIEHDLAYNYYIEKEVCVVCGSVFGEKFSWCDWLMSKRTESGLVFDKLNRDIVMVAVIRGASSQHVWSEYAHLFFYESVEAKHK